MSSSSSWIRRSLWAVAVGGLGLGLGGCGFQPLHGQSVGATEKLAEVEIGPLPERRGLMLRNNLIDRFYYASGRPAHPRYRLEATLQAVEQRTAIRKDSTSERAQLVISVPYRLVEMTTGRTAMEGRSRVYIPYEYLDNRFAALSVLDNAYERGLLEISDDITLRVAAFLGRGS